MLESCILDKMFLNSILKNSLKGEPEYLDPHGHHDIDRGYIWKHAQEKEGIDSCIDQCKWMQDQNISPHHFQG